jgi:hypothetical protein
LAKDVQANSNLKRVMDLQNDYVREVQKELPPLLDRMAAWASAAGTQEVMIKRRDFIGQARQATRLLSYCRIWNDPLISDLKGVDTLSARKKCAKLAMDAGVIPPEELWTGKPIPESFFSECQSHIGSVLSEKSVEIDPEEKYFNEKSYDLMIRSGLTQILGDSILELSSGETKQLFQMSILSAQVKNKQY